MCKNWLITNQFVHMTVTSNNIFNDHRLLTNYPRQKYLSAAPCPSIYAEYRGETAVRDKGAIGYLWTL